MWIRWIRIRIRIRNTDATSNRFKMFSTEPAIPLLKIKINIKCLDNIRVQNIKKKKTLQKEYSLGYKSYQLLRRPPL
jgi:TATA-binding protein-associated factor Taf7